MSIEKDTKRVIQDCKQLKNSLLRLKNTTLKAEENNTQIFSANPYISLIDDALNAITILRSDLQETVAQEKFNENVRKFGPPEG